MELLYFVGTIWSLLFLTVVLNFDTRRPMSEKLKYKYRVKDDSIFRKIIKFKDKENYPCNYFKIVPIYIFLLLALLSSILLLVDVLTGLITKVIFEDVITIIAICVLVIFMLYFLVLIIWWEIVDYKEFKFTKEEKEELKRLRKFRKESKKNKK